MPPCSVSGTSSMPWIDFHRRLQLPTQECCQGIGKVGTVIGIQSGGDRPRRRNGRDSGREVEAAAICRRLWTLRVEARSWTWRTRLAHDVAHVGEIRGG